MAEFVWGGRSFPQTIREIDSERGIPRQQLFEKATLSFAVVLPSMVKSGISWLSPGLPCLRFSFVIYLVHLSFISVHLALFQIGVLK